MTKRKTSCDSDVGAMRERKFTVAFAYIPYSSEAKAIYSADKV